MLSGSPYNLASGIKATAAALGVNPVDLATAISYETAGTFNPTIAGPKTKWGRHRGLIQFGEPQARQYGVDWNDPIGSQLGPDGAVTKYLRDTGVQPGMGLLDIYSAINAGGVRRYNRSDAAAGGAPGTVADKVTKQMAGHRKKALALLGGDERITPVSSDVTADTKGSPMRSLLGNSGGVNPEMVSLLGLDPAELRRQAIWSGLAQAGAQLAQTGTLAGAAGGFAQGVNQGRENYMQEALLGYRMREDEAERQYREQERQNKIMEEQRQQEAMNALLSGVDPKVRPFAEAFPNVFAAQYAQSLFPDNAAASEPKSYAPIPYDMGGGKIGYGIPMEDGSFRPVQVPEGAQFLSPYDKAYQTNAGATRGKTVTEQELSASSDLAAADQALDLIRQVERHDGLNWGTGIWSLGNIVPGTSGYDFQNLVEQVKSGAFLTAIDQLRGMGALSNMEGQAATAAVTRINTATSKEAFLKALDDYRKIVEAGRMRAVARVPGSGQVIPQQPQQTAPAPAVPDLSTLSDAELEALANGQ